MTERQFINRVSNSKGDFLKWFIDILEEENIPFCVIGGLGVNAYVEPVVSLDLDLVISPFDLERLIALLGEKVSIKKEKDSVNISSPLSDLRIQIQTDPKYQGFIKNASYKNVLGYKLPVASCEDILEGKIWAFQDKERRPSKRKKDIADIMRLVEKYPHLIEKLPDVIKNEMQKPF